MSQLKQKQKEYMSKNIQAGGFYDWNNNVLNGIAYNKASDTFFFTGKMWDLVFEIKLLE